MATVAFEDAGFVPLRPTVLGAVTEAVRFWPMAVTVKGGGATIPAKLYSGSVDSILPATFNYVAAGSGYGKQAFLTNDPMRLSQTGTVHFAASDSTLTDSELSTYMGLHTVH